MIYFISKQYYDSLNNNLFGHWKLILEFIWDLPAAGREFEFWNLKI